MPFRFFGKSLVLPRLLCYHNDVNIKRRNVMKRVLAFIICIMMTVSLFNFTASAEVEGSYGYIVENGKAAIFEVNEFLTGDVVVPSTLGGYPVTGIERGAFMGIEGITGITIPDCVTYIGENAFSDCTALESVSIGDGVTSVTWSAFENCISLESVDFGSSLTAIGEWAFYNCQSLKSITIPEGVKSIGSCAFSHCAGLESVTIPEGVTYIGRQAFAFCTKLESISIPDSIALLEQGIIDGTAYYADEDNWDDGLLYVGKHLVRAKETLVGDIEIKEGTKTIASAAFTYCGELESVKIPSGVTYIGSDTFYECTSLKSVTIPEGVTQINSYLFGNCESLESVIIPEGVTHIHKYAFYNCTSLENVDFPDSVTYVGMGVLYETPYFNNEANRENGVLYNGKHLIDANYDINGTYAIKDGTKTVAVEAFANCGNLTGVVIPLGVTSIGESAFVYCNNLESISIPDSVTYIGSDAFWGTEYLNNDDNWEDGALYIDNHLIEARLEGEYEIKEGTRNIAGKAFYWLQDLTEISIPSSVTSIGYRAFEGCYGLAEVTVPSSVVSIDVQAFNYCKNIENVYFEDTENWNVNGVALSSDDLADPEKAAEYLVNTYSDFAWTQSKKTGDINGSGNVEASDAIYLLYHVFFGEERYPVDGNVDINNDGEVDSKDAIYLLYHVFFGEERYPLYPENNDAGGGGDVGGEDSGGGKTDGWTGNF